MIKEVYQMYCIYLISILICKIDYINDKIKIHQMFCICIISIIICKIDYVNDKK